MARKSFFTFLYWFRKTPWDTGITPPEVLRFLENNPPGRALDLGCGTGTNVITMAEHGWQATGTDFVPRAIRVAQRKARRQDLAGQADFFVGDVLSPDSFQGAYDLILDIGCFHSFSGPDVETYGENARAHLVPGGSLLVYAHLDQGLDSSHGATEASLETLGEFLTLRWRENGEESARPSAWLEFVKTP